MSITGALAQFVANAEPPASVNQTVRDAIADCFGCILAGSNSEVTQRVLGGLSSISLGPVSLYGRTETCSAGYAAMINAVSGHAYELDDWEEAGNTHPTVVLLPALLTAASLRQVSGRELLNAYAVGFEVIVRLGEAITLEHYARGFHATATLGTLGAAAAVSRLLKLDANDASNAIALSVSQALGYAAQFGTNAKPLQAGFSARAGLECGLMAANGITANLAAIEDVRGMLGLLGNFDQQRLDNAAGRLGKPWALEEYSIVFKPWPSCGYAHRLMTAALELRDRLGGKTEEIKRIAATQPDFHNAILLFDRPTTRNEALFSGPACIAQMLVTGELGLKECENRFWEAAEVDRLISITHFKAEPAKNPEINYDPEQPDMLTLTLKNGDSLQQSCTYPLGSPQNPMNAEQLAGKFAIQ